MAFKVQTFRDNMRGDGARPSLFEVNVPFPGFAGTPSQPLRFMAKAASLPASTIGTKTVSYFGQDVHFAGDRTYADWTITVYNDEGFRIRNSFEKWLDNIHSHSQGRAQQGSEGSVRSEAAGLTGYTVDAEVYQYSKLGGIIKSYKFYHMFPTEISNITVDWDSKDEIESFDVTLKYDYYQALEASNGQLSQITT